MPIRVDQILGAHTRLLLWDVTETESDLAQGIALPPARAQRLAGMKSETHRRGFLAIRHLLKAAGYTDSDLLYGPTGKPRLADGTCISISHSHEMAGILLSQTNIGLDIERIKPTILRIAPKFLSEIERAWCDLEDTTYVTLLWCVKEAVFKVKDQVGISFKDHIHTHALFSPTLHSVADLNWQNQLETYSIYGQIHNEYALVYTHEATTTL